MHVTGERRLKGICKWTRRSSAAILAAGAPRRQCQANLCGRKWTRAKPFIERADTEQAEEHYHPQLVISKFFEGSCLGQSAQFKAGAFVWCGMNQEECKGHVPRSNNEASGNLQKICLHEIERRLKNFGTMHLVCLGIAIERDQQYLPVHVRT